MDFGILGIRKIGSAPSLYSLCFMYSLHNHKSNFGLKNEKSPFGYKAVMLLNFSPMFILNFSFCIYLESELLIWPLDDSLTSNNKFIKSLLSF